nr:MAG TPA: hypothetical protein [Caudoviricetes sp.]
MKIMKNAVKRHIERQNFQLSCRKILMRSFIVHHVRIYRTCATNGPVERVLPDFDSSFGMLVFPIWFIVWLGQPNFYIVSKLRQIDTISQPVIIAIYANIDAGLVACQDKFEYRCRQCSRIHSVQNLATFRFDVQPDANVVCDARRYQRTVQRNECVRLGPCVVRICRAKEMIYADRQTGRDGVVNVTLEIIVFVNCTIVTALAHFDDAKFIAFLHGCIKINVWLAIRNIESLFHVITSSSKNVPVFSQHVRLTGQPSYLGP